MTKNLLSLILALFVLTFLNSSLNCQTFTKIVTGSIVNDTGNSWGCAWNDYNNDGFPDLFVSNIGNEFLYMGHGDTTFTKITAGSIVNDGGDSRGSSWGDYDNDGYSDLFVPNNGINNFLYHNDGTPNFTFTKITTGAIVGDASAFRGSSWIDYDKDGYLDMFVCNNGFNFLYHNNGNGSFTKITSSVLINDGGLSLCPAWADYDNDGNQDLFITHNASNNLFYHNNGDGTFTKIATGAIVGDVANFASASWGDYDNDGNLDMFVSNFNGHNYLYHNDGPPNYTFTKIITGAIVTDAAANYAANWIDYDNDGYIDMYVVNFANNFLYHNDGPPNYTFTRITTGALANDSGVSYGSAWADINRDGFMDVFISRHPGTNALFLNHSNSNSWVNIKCKGIMSNQSAIGTRINVKATINGNAVWQTRIISGQSAYYSQNSLEAGFGFGNAAAIDSLVILWPRGQRDVYTNVILNKFYLAVEGQGINPIGIKPISSEVPSSFNLAQNFPNPFNPSTKIKFSLPKSSFAVLKIYNILGKESAVLVNENLKAGTYEVSWNASQFSSGIYFYEIQSADFTQTRKMILLK